MQIQTLNDLWIDTAPQLVGIYGTNEATRVRLAFALGLGRAGLDAIVNAAQRLEPRSRRAVDAALEIEAQSADYPLGALLEDPAQVGTRTAGILPYAGSVPYPLPESHSLLRQLPPLRSQGHRSTCVAFAVLSVLEQMEVAAGATPELDLSEQYVYWWCKERDGLPGRNGTYLSLGMRCLNEAGAPFESLWPYVDRPTADQGQGPPPDAAVRGDAGFCVAQTLEFNRSDIAGIKACVAEGRSVCFSLPVYDSWFKSSAMARWGKITMPLPGEPLREGHAMTIVGYQDEARAPGGGYFLLRNSWQPWAWDGVWAPGYGYIPYAYVSHHASTIFSARRSTSGKLALRGEKDGDVIVNSPDVWLRQAPDSGLLPQAGQAGVENALYMRLFNDGLTYLYGVQGEIYFRGPGSAVWARAAEFNGVWLPPGETVLGPFAWIAPSSDHFALAVRLAWAQSQDSFL